jgi:nitrogen-specific signal transduction histidine kinase/CheY-like chemotaxis protein
VIVECEALGIDFDGAPASVVLARDLTERHELFARLGLADRIHSVGTIAAAVAHEINNPLAYVMLNLTMLSDRLPTALTGEFAERATSLRSLALVSLEGVDQMRAIVRDLRMLSRSRDEAAYAVDVQEPLESALRIANAEIRHHARLVVSYGETQPVLSTPARLGQVFLNLLVNAAHSFEGKRNAGNEIRVATRASGDGVVVEIADTGCGISPELTARIFDPFFTTKPPGRGTGLGLSICRSIVESLGGRIGVRSVVGEGTAFTVELPAAARAPVHCASPATGPRPRGRRVLVIDDEARFASSVKALLSDEHDVVALTRAVDALARLSAGEAFDAVICDLMMPGMSGPEFYDRLRSLSPALADRIVFVTGGAFSPEAQAFMARTPVTFLEKPVDPESLRAELDRVLAGPPVAWGA